LAILCRRPGAAFHCEPVSRILITSLFQKNIAMNPPAKTSRRLSPEARGQRQAQLQALRRQLVLDAAQRVFEREGLEKTTVRAIAHEAGCTTGAIYPWFEGKEAIYGALLEDSLNRLHGALAAALAASAPADAARSVIQAFFQYYAARQGEFSLGLYLFQGTGPRGLGREADARLNALLLACVDALGEALVRTRPGLAPARETTQMNVFTYLMGLLLLLHTRRLKSLGQRAEPLLDQYCLALERP